MAKKTQTEEHEGGADEGQSTVAQLIDRARRTGSTGRVVMLAQPRGAKAALSTLSDKAGVAMVSTADTRGADLAREDLGDKGCCSTTSASWWPPWSPTRSVASGPPSPPAATPASPSRGRNG